jgi:putative transposase
MAYKCRAYPDPEQASVLNRTFGCVRVVWNRTLAWRRQRYLADKTGTTYAQASAYLTAMKATGEFTWLNEVAAVPLQQAIRHQQAAYAAFFAGRARYPRFKSRTGRQCAEYTRSGFRWRDGALFLAKMGTALGPQWNRFGALAARALSRYRPGWFECGSIEGAWTCNGLVALGGASVVGPLPCALCRLSS